jgi:hypothetical protein
MEFSFLSAGNISLALHSRWFEPKTNSTEDVKSAERAMQFYVSSWPFISSLRVYNKIVTVLRKRADCAKFALVASSNNSVGKVR